MQKKIIIIGAVAVGPKVACRLRRLDPHAAITVIDKDNLISYGGCGIPYYVGGDINDLEDLYSTASHTLRDQEFFKQCKGIEVLTRVKGIEVQRAEKQLVVQYLDNDTTETLDYDKLVFATGATPLRPPFPGSDLPRVFTISDLHDASAIKTLMTQGKVSSAVVIGAGAIGVEISEAMTDLWGIQTTLVEMEDQILPTLFGKCIARIGQQHLTDRGVDLLLGEKVNQITESGDGKLKVETTGPTLTVDIVVLATGVRPNTQLAVKAGISVGNSGGILVDRRMRTNDPDIYAGGDCIELRNLVSGENMLMALGSLANRQGRVIATNISGGSSHFTGTVGTFCLKLFDMGLAKAGLTYRQAKETGFDPVYSVISQTDRAHFYPSSELLFISLIADKKTRKVLGIEVAGKHGDAVKSRVDTVAVLLKHGIDVDDVCTLESGYAPPFASAMDAVNNAGNALDNILSGLNTPVDAYDFLQIFSKGEIQVLDIRGNKEATPFLEKFPTQWKNIPQSDLRDRYEELDPHIEYFLLCDTGPRSYEAQVFLTSVGYSFTQNVQGGYAMIKAIKPDFVA